MKFEFDLQLFKGGKGGNQTTTVRYPDPSEQEKKMQELALGYADKITPIVNQLTQGAGNLLNHNYGMSNVDYGSYMKDAMGQIGSAQTGIGDLTQGKLPTAYTDNMAQAVQSGVDKTVGGAINNLAQRGVLNSSVTSGAMNDISKNVSDTMAQQYQNNIGLLSGLYGQQMNSALGKVQAGATGQQAALQSPLNLLNAASGLQNAGVNNTLAQLAAGRTGSQQTTTSGGGGTGFLGTLLGGFLGGL